jgi:hypothetical protein
VTKFSHARNRMRIRSNVGVSLTANIVGAILKQAGLSESVSRSARVWSANSKFVKSPRRVGGH